MKPQLLRNKGSALKKALETPKLQRASTRRRKGWGAQCILVCGLPVCEIATNGVAQNNRNLSPAVWRPEVLTLGIAESSTLPEALGEESPSSPASGGCWHPSVCVCIPLISASIFLRPSLLCIRLLPQLMVISSGDPSLVTSAKPLALNKVHSEVPDEHEVWGGH